MVLRPTSSRFLREISNAVLIFTAILSAGMGLKGFLAPSGFIDGGVTGVSMLLAKISPLPLALWLPLANLPFLVLGYRQLGAAFALRGTLAIGGLALALWLLAFPAVTPDPILSAIFGGFFIGAGIGLAVRGGAALDGTEIAALLISKRMHFLRVGDVILGFNIVLFLAALSVLTMEQVLYSIVTYFTAARTLDFVIYGLEQFTAITVVSSESVAIRKAITGTLGRGVTVLKGYGGMSKQEQEILYCVVTRLEIGKVKEITRAIDAQAFLTIHPLADAEGGVVKRSGTR